MQSAPSTERNIALAQIMNDMEHDFRIPDLRNPAWERANLGIISLYRIISKSRTTV